MCLARHVTHTYQMLATVARDSPVRASALVMRCPRKAFAGDDSEDRTVKRGHGGPSDSKLELELHSPKLVENLPLFRAVKA